MAELLRATATEDRCRNACPALAVRIDWPGMNQRRIIAWGATLVILVLLVVVVAMAHRQAASNQILIARTRQIGQDLISHANSAQLPGLPPGMAGQLANLLGSPTHVAAVLLGDEPPPVGDGSACTRLILTNQLAKGLKIRLGPASTPDKLRIMGYWPTSSSPGAR